MKKKQLIIHVPKTAKDNTEFNFICRQYCSDNDLDFVVTFDQSEFLGTFVGRFSDLHRMSDQVIMNRNDGKREYIKNRFGACGVIKEKKMSFIQKLKFLFS